MVEIHKKLIVNEQGKPMEVIIPFHEFQEIEEMLGLDLSLTELDDLRAAKEDRKNNKKSSYTPLDDV